jgi:hypothetical protein
MNTTATLRNDARPLYFAVQAIALLATFGVTVLTAISLLA